MTPEKKSVESEPKAPVKMMKANPLAINSQHCKPHAYCKGCEKEWCKPEDKKA